MSFIVKVSVIISALVVVNTERWYSATIIEKRDFHNSTDSKFRTDYTQNNENANRFMPLMLIDPRRNEYERRERISANIFNFAENNNSESSFEPISLKMNDTSKNDVQKRSRPKRKHVIKKCPSARSRQLKQFHSKPKTKTRFLEVFQVVEFDHVSCTSSSGLEGTCLPEYKCTESGGSTMGSCADGYGTCCVSKYLYYKYYDLILFCPYFLLGTYCSFSAFLIGHNFILFQHYFSAMITPLLRRVGSSTQIFLHPVLKDYHVILLWTKHLMI